MKWQKKYVRLFQFSNRGIERLEIYENEDDIAKRCTTKVIGLETCIKISSEPQKNQPFAFSILTSSNTHYFSGSSHEDSQEWLSACQDVAFEDNFSRTTIEEDNELYCPSVDAGVYRVSLVNSEVSQRCNLAPGEYTLVVASEELQLRHHDTQNLIYTWPYRFIRRYGHKRGRFTFEAGRKCASGEGTFDLEHNNAQEIFACMAAKMEYIKKKMSSGNLMGMGGSCTSVDSDDALAVAVSMSARSRSPLIPSSFTSLSPSLVVTSSHIPAKPPRKINQQTPAPPPLPPAPPRYDTVEIRQEAWKTLGTNEAVHTERQFTSNAVFTAPAHSDYDKLDHFGTVSNQEVDPAYQTIYRQDSSGYGVIRKVKTPEHNIYNEMEYAVVCKAHKV
ncbi:docking protein 2 isoform X2 [Cimex lectularius]|uniref:Insulin receptor substrate 1 n=1 Tax=Cimex lectularius TaxID=79782 RepID=A0A8I6S646_CIMLE|nr:docking protein 2 isoform X2 [Cimex lectularius]